MEQILEEQKTAKTKRKAEATVVKDYSALYQKGWDVFTMLGESKAIKDLSNKKDNLRDIIIKTLNDNDYNDSNIHEKLFSNYQGLPFTTFSELIDVIEDGYEANYDIKNDSVLEIINKFVPSIKNYMERIANRSEKFDVKDLIALTQYKRINQNKLDEKQLLTDEKIKQDRLVLSNNAVAYAKEGQKTNEQKPYYDFAAIQFTNYKNDLLLPIKNYYSNEPLLNKNEESFENYDAFMQNLKEQNYKFKTFEKRYPEADDILVEGKSIFVANQKDTPIENALYIMYKINKEELNKKSKFLPDKRYKKAAKLFSSVSNKHEDNKFNSYKDFKHGKADFNEYRHTLNEVIANLATINSARIYMEGSTFKKVEEHLELMASMQLATLPTKRSSWMLPYISERVLQLSKQNYERAGITDLQELKELYSKTGRKVDTVNSIDELIFSKANYSFDAKAKRSSVKGQKDMGSRERTIVDELEDDDLLANLNKNQPLYKMYREQYKEAIKMQPDAKDQVKSEKNEKQEQTVNVDEEEKQEKQDTNNITFAKLNLKNFLKENLIAKSKENLSITPEISKNSDYIMELRKSGVDLKKVVDVVYNEISKDMDKNESNYKTENGRFYSLGTLIFKKYFVGPKGELTPRTQFKKILQETVAKIEKTNSQEQTV